MSGRAFRRNTLIAAVISAAEFSEFERWAAARRRQTLGDVFDDVREI